MTEYNFYPKQDSIGHDLIRLPLDKCEEYCNTHPEAIAYNTLGYIKSNIEPPNKWIDTVWNQPAGKEGMYVKKNYDPIQKAKDKIMTNIDSKVPVTFTVTTCKRLNYFIKTMNAFLVQCKDNNRIQEWLCVDDNSSESDREVMQRLFPFFRFIFKTPEQKGHAISMNIILNEVHTPYILHYEDDWLVHTPFSMVECYNWLVSNETYSQLILRKIDRKNKNKIDVIDSHTIYAYKGNIYHYLKPQINRKLDELYQITDKFESADRDWWWPGLSLNPSIIIIETIREKIGLFNTTIIPELFEYEYALRYYINGLQSAYVDLPIYHIGEQSSYVLNNEYRSHD